MEGAGDVASLLAAIEQSALGRAARGSAWLYPLANTLHVLGAMAFFAAVAAMDARLLGGLKALAPGPFIAAARQAAIAAFALVAATGATLFASEATTLAKNPAFLWKGVLIGLGLLNVALLSILFGRALAMARPNAAMPGGARLIAAASLAIWLAAAACGRMIAYV